MLVFVGLLAIVGVAHASVGSACLSGTGCGANECCMKAGHMKGRDVTGTCQMMGTTTSNQGCYVENHFLLNGVYTNKCPCASGYKCESTGMMEVPYGMMGKCQKQIQTQKMCKTGGDCAADECCMSLMRPLGKRQLGGGGVCKPMGTSGASCLLKYGAGKTKDAVYQCPCTAGMTCKANGQFDIPLGPMGVCT